MKRLEHEVIEDALAALAGWANIGDHHIVKRYGFTNFAGALAFVNAVASEAEAQDHHPNLRLGWGYAQVEIHTHSAGGLTGKDFTLAAACEALAEAQA